jgi:hypothetical protein
MSRLAYSNLNQTRENREISTEILCDTLIMYAATREKSNKSLKKLLGTYKIELGENG